MTAIDLIKNNPDVYGPTARLAMDLIGFELCVGPGYVVYLMKNRVKCLEPQSVIVPVGRAS